MDLDVVQTSRSLITRASKKVNGTGKGMKKKTWVQHHIREELVD